MSVDQERDFENRVRRNKISQELLDDVESILLQILSVVVAII